MIIKLVFWDYIVVIVLALFGNGAGRGCSLVLTSEIG